MKARRAGDLATAERFYRKLNKAAPQDPNGPMLLGMLHAQSRRFDDAERFLARAIVIAPNPEALNNYGAVLVELARSQEATVRLQRVVRAKPDYAEAHFNPRQRLLALGGDITPQS